jgi:hypothetical protein
MEVSSIQYLLNTSPSYVKQINKLKKIEKKRVKENSSTHRYTYFSLSFSNKNKIKKKIQQIPLLAE